MSEDLRITRDAPMGLVGGAPLTKQAMTGLSGLVCAYVGVDGGADALLEAGVDPVAVIGDLDSLSDQARATFRDRLHHVAEQDTTDFEKALTRIKAPLVLAVGFTGGRFDHALSVLNVLARHRAPAVILIDAHDVSFMVHHGTCTFETAAQTRVSLMPVGQAVVTATGLRWPFAQRRMAPDGFVSASNAASGGTVTVTTDAPVLVTLPRAALGSAMAAKVTRI